MSKGELIRKLYEMAAAMQQLRDNRDDWVDYGRAVKQAWDGNPGRFNRRRGKEPAARVKWEAEMDGHLYPKRGDGWVMNESK
jgi:hypothetical protein